ncbi:SPOR domain-containing protein [Undibacterium arcticum]|uniref:SPOR domain-containing protein n=1 Tax=Undibacterium arcticum TaxID=1762892 RepID=A0ABV7F3U8_9BURK
MIKQNTQQQGGTLLGLIIGLIIGLAIAVVVAMAITKTSLPFSNKPGKADRSTDQEIVSDPNKPLYGNKDATRQVAKDFVKPPQNLPQPDAVSTDRKADAKPVGRSDLKTDTTKPDTKTADQTAVDKTAKVDKPADSKDSVAKPAASDDKWTYYLQAGAFRDQSDAENTRAKLALLGFEAQISERPSDSGSLYRVRIGPFGQIETMNRIRGKLSESGVDVAVVRSPK